MNLEQTAAYWSRLKNHTGDATKDPRGLWKKLQDGRFMLVGMQVDGTALDELLNCQVRKNEAQAELQEIVSEHQKTRLGSIHNNTAMVQQQLQDQQEQLQASSRPR